MVSGVTLLQDRVPIPSHHRELVTTSLEDVGEQLVEEVPPPPAVAGAGWCVHVNEGLTSTFNRLGSSLN